jgi:hypothetical protein
LLVLSPVLLPRLLRRWRAGGLQFVLCAGRIGRCSFARRFRVTAIQRADYSTSNDFGEQRGERSAL